MRWRPPNINPKRKIKHKSEQNQNNNSSNNNRILSVIFLAIGLYHLPSAEAKKKSDGACERLSPVDVYLLVPTSAHVDRDRLGEVKKTDKFII